eukprot:scaffold4998_cov178-Alexandrium_tamarense.AAC.7
MANRSFSELPYCECCPVEGALADVEVKTLLCLFCRREICTRDHEINRLPFPRSKSTVKRKRSVPRVLIWYWERSYTKCSRIPGVNMHWT